MPWNLVMGCFLFLSLSFLSRTISSNYFLFSILYLFLAAFHSIRFVQPQLLTATTKLIPTGASAQLQVDATL